MIVDPRELFSSNVPTRDNEKYRDIIHSYPVPVWGFGNAHNSLASCNRRVAGPLNQGSAKPAIIQLINPHQTAAFQLIEITRLSEILILHEQIIEA